MSSISEEIKSEFTNHYNKAVVNILYTANWIKNIHAESLQSYGVSVQQYNILRILRGHGDWLQMTEVKARMIEKSPNTTRLADKLLLQNYIIRKRCDVDRRVVFVKLADKGLDLLLDLDKHWVNGLDESVFKDLSLEEANALSNALDKLREVNI